MQVFVLFQKTQKYHSELFLLQESQNKKFL